MALLPVQCQNCGAKYKIPETFQSDSAKCKACGSVIDVKAARDGAGDAASEPAGKSIGGTRKPRQTAAAGRSARRRGGDDEVEAKPKRSARRAGTLTSRRGRGRHEEDDDEAEEGRRSRYEKKKDNTPLIAGVVGLGLAVVALILYLIWDSGEKPVTDNDKLVAAKTDENQKAGDAATKETEKAAAEAAAKKAAEAEAAKEAAAKKKARSRPKTKRQLAIKKEEDVKSPSDVFKPSSALQPLPKPESLSDDDVKEIQALIAEIRGSGLPSIRAATALKEKGVVMIPIAVNEILKLDFTKPADNSYCYRLTEVIRAFIESDYFGFEQVLAVEDDEFDFVQGHRNASKVWDLHRLAQIYWHSPEGLAKFKRLHGKDGDEE